MVPKGFEPSKFDCIMTFCNAHQTSERQPQKHNFGYVRIAKIQISLRIRAVWSESSLGAFWIIKDAVSLSGERGLWLDRTGRLIWVFAWECSRYCSFFCYVDFGVYQTISFHFINCITLQLTPQRDSVQNQNEAYHSKASYRVFEIANTKFKSDISRLFEISVSMTLLIMVLSISECQLHFCLSIDKILILVSKCGAVERCQPAELYLSEFIRHWGICLRVWLVFWNIRYIMRFRNGITCAAERAKEPAFCFVKPKPMQR